jgi:NADPH:quinone reductase-like Zn-dependent oxidoreductase
MATENRVALMTGPGKNLEVTVVGVQHPAPGEVLVRNHAVVLQPLDAKMLVAGYGQATQLSYPAVLGTSGAGIIEEVGEGVGGLSIGDKVVFDTKAYVKVESNLHTGTWQQLVVCDAKTVAKV